MLIVLTFCIALRMLVVGRGFGWRFFTEVLAPLAGHLNNFLGLVLFVAVQRAFNRIFAWVSQIIVSGLFESFWVRRSDFSVFLVVCIENREWPGSLPITNNIVTCNEIALILLELSEKF